MSPSKRFDRPCVGLVLILSLASYSLAAQDGPLSFVRNLGMGYNLGNTLEATSGSPGTKIADYEVGWGAPRTTREIFVDLKARGFSTIRIPVAWSNLLGEGSTIHPDLMNRVQEVVDMVTSTGLYAIVNIHWDGGWITEASTQPAKTMAKFERLWTQIAQRFRDYDDHLIFEDMNEEGHFDDVWNRYGSANPTGQKTAFDLLNNLNQKFTDIVRSSGGSNASRYLLIAGYATDIDLTCLPAFHLPADPAGRSLVSVHYYSPATFAILEQDASWGKARNFWGTTADIAQVEQDFAKLKARFLDQGIGVILGEFGCVEKNKESASVERYLATVAKTAFDLGICPIFWGGADGQYDRVARTFKDPVVGDMFQSLARRQP